MSIFWSDGIPNLKPYIPGEQPIIPGLVKLNTNENPYPPSPKVLDAIHQATDDELRLYPDPESRSLKAAIAAAHQIAPESVFVGNSSDEVLAHTFLGLLKHQLPHNLPVQFPDITYSFYPVYCALYDISSATVPLDGQFQIQVEDYQRASGGIILPNPNAPTGSALTRDTIRKLLENNPDCVVVIDEAYIDFGGETAIPLINTYPNLLVVQTLSKSRSLAGLRVGFAVGHPVLIEALERVKGSFNSYPLDRLAQAGAVAAMRDADYFEITRQKIIASRSWLITQMEALNFDILPSLANFIFVRHSSFDAAQLQKQLRERNILVRHFALPRIDQFLRISIGTRVQCQTLVYALKEILNAENDGHAE